MEKLYQIIKNKLAVEGIGEDEHPMIRGDFRIRDDGWYQVDARTISDLGYENDIMDYETLIDRASISLSSGNKCVIVCGAGQSRSNAIALGILVHVFDMDFYDAWELIKKRVPTSLIDPSHISKLKKLFGVTIP